MPERSTPTRRGRLARQVIQRAFFSPPSLGLLSASLVFAAEPATWIPAGLLAALNAALIFAQARNPQHIRRVAEELYRDRWREQVNRAEELQRTLDRPTASIISDIIGSQERLLSLGAEGEGVSLTRSQAGDVLAHCLQLAQKRLELQNFVLETRAGDLAGDTERLRRQVLSTDDPVARELFEQALQQKLSEGENLQGIENAIARIDGQLQAVAATFDNLAGKIVRLRSTSSAVDTLEERHVLQELSHLSMGVSALEASLSETCAIGTTR